MIMSYKVKTTKNYKNSDPDYTNSDNESGEHGKTYKNAGSSRAQTRSAEFRSSRSGASSRSTFRGGRRGETTPRRGDRDYGGDGYYGSRKYENNRNESSSGYRGKVYESDKKSDVKLNLPEDTRISKLLRRLNNETNQEASLQISRKLLDVLMLPDNASYVRKAFHILGESMYEILHVSPGPLAKNQAARALGRMAYIMGQEGDFDRFQNWLFTKLTSSYDEMQLLLVISLKETLKMEMENQILEEHIENLINNLVSILEVTENVDIFKAVLEVLVETVELYPNEFYNQFRDTIDLLFGWHVDHNQPLQLIEFISSKMQKLSQHFKCNVDFAVGLIENFLEDVCVYKNELQHVTVLILATNTVLKCLEGCKLVGVEDFLKTIIEAIDGQSDGNLIIAGNNCLNELLGFLEVKSLSLSCKIFKLIEKYLKLDLEDSILVSMLLLVARVVKELSGNLPEEFVQLLLGQDSVLVKLRSIQFSEIKNAVICVYQSLVNLKNVSLLQEVYKFLMEDLERCFKEIFEAKNPKNSEIIVLFLLRSLSQLANGSSIIVMWALKPSLLELVGAKLQPHSAVLAQKYPQIQFCLLNLLYSHCKCFNHFITNSNLVIKNDFNRFALNTENSNNFEVILDVLYNCLKSCKNFEVATLLLQWLLNILDRSELYIESFYSNEKFLNVADILIETGYCFDSNIVLIVGKNLEKLLINKQLNWPNIFLIKVVDLCKLHMNSNNEEIKNCFSELARLIPWDVNCVELNKTTFDQQIGDFNHYTIKMAQTLHLNGSFECELSPQQFKKISNFLLNNEFVDFEEIFITSWVQDYTNQIDTELFYNLALTSREVLNKYIALEAAQFCVNYKLRTPLGKPNETFTKIEFALNQLGNKKIESYAQHNRVNMLLQFLEYLEKSIYNASEGCAVAMRQPSKTVRQFFIANANTCNEWLLRLRIVVMNVALHSGEVAVALRHGQNLLIEIKPTAQDFKKILIFVAMSLLSLREPEALLGLYVWAKAQNQNLKWLKCASDQASRKFEIAIDGYKKILDDTSEEVQSFICNQLIICYKELHDYPSLMQLEPKNTDFKILNSDCNFTLEQLGSWELKNEKSSWSVYDNLANIESNLYNYLASNTFEPQTHTTIQQNIQNLLNLSPNEFLQTYSLLQYIATGLDLKSQQKPTQEVFLVSESFDFKKIDSSILNKILWWSEQFNQGSNLFSSNLRLEVVKRARKESNLNFASTQLEKFFQTKQINFTNLSEFTEKTDLSFFTLDNSQAVIELIKLAHAKNSDDTFNLCALISTSISKYSEIYSSQEHKKLSSKLLLKLANWMQTTEINCTELRSPLGKLLMVLPELPSLEDSIPSRDVAIGKLLQFSANQCQSLAKSWNSFGNWCYKWGKKIVDNDTKSLSDEYRSEIKNLLPPDHSLDDLEKIYSILSEPRDDDKNPSQSVETRLRQITVLEHSNLIGRVMEIWQKNQKSLYFYYSLSAEAYFKYLQLSETNCNTITITLRLLRLTVKYALELQTILEQGLQTTPTQPWKSIIPQLFSRLNHPESYVRHRVSDLLCRVAQDAPHLITFPAVVGALEGNFNEIRLLEEEEEEEEEYESEGDGLQSCFETMVETLKKQDAETIGQVQLLVKELRRITLLWDELWLGTLAQHQSEIGKRQHQLEYEIEKVNENSNLSADEKSSLIAEKHRIIVKPIVFVLEQLRQVTGAEPETPHERLFQEKYLADIDRVISQLKNPDFPEKPHESLAPLKQLQKKFQQKFHKRASYSLKMRDISPVLWAIKDTPIAMPGVATNTNVTIESVGDVVSILPTKTKPKKLVFYGSDGKTYTYLFKGLEDLHLDERIMQFLSIANTMMAQNADPAGENLYRARHYSVIPLGPRSGLISWVDGTTPVFALYKRWQQRELAKPNAKGSTTVPRPSELFYNKLVEHGVSNIDNRKEWPLAVLKEVLTELTNETPSDLIAKELWCNAVSANAWWQVVKRYSYSVAVMSIIGYIIGLGDRHLDNVLIDLSTGDVVHIDYNVCFEKGKTLRVPEKVPFRLTPNIRDALGVTGVEGIFRMACENVLKTMRKGRETLLTLLEAFVYDPLIDWTVGGEVLAGSTFAGGGAGQSKKELEREVTLAMFDVRCTEMTVEWQENKEDIVNEVPALIDHLDKCLDLTEEVEETEEELRDFHQQLALVKEAEAQGPKKHPLYKLPALYEAYVNTQGATNVAHKTLTDIKRDSDMHAQAFAQLLDSYEAQQFSHWLAELNFDESDDSMRIFDLVKEFLRNAGKDDIVAQCEQSETEVSQLFQHLNLHTRKCIQTFQDYFSLLVQCPKSYIDRHRTTLYPKWIDYLLDTKTLEGCDTIFEEFKAFLDGDVLNGSQIVSCACALDAFYKKSLLQVNKLYEELGALKSRDLNAETSYDRSKKKIEEFSSREALEFVLAGELLGLNRNLLNSEMTAQKSGTWLIKLMSLDGDWFLDDLLLQSTRIVEIIDCVPIRDDEDPRLAQVTAGIKTGNAVYKGLNELNFNFHTIILPETMKKIMADEDSVLTMIAELTRVIAEVGMPIEELIGELEKLLTCVLMHVDVHTTHDYLLDKIATTKTQYHTLLQSEGHLTQGTMLLMGFNGLFEKVNQEITAQTLTLGSLDLPKPWKKLDHVTEAKTISPHIFNPKIKKILDSLFFLKKILAIFEFFDKAQKMCKSLKCLGDFVVFSDEILNKPVRQFISEFIGRQVLGVLPEAISYLICLILQKLKLDVTHEIDQKDFGAESKVSFEDLYKKSYQILIKRNCFGASDFSEASGLLLSLKNSWTEHQKPKQLEQKLACLRSSLFRLQTQLAIHNLMFDDVLSMNNFPSTRQKFILDRHSELNQLRNLYQQLNEAQKNQKLLIEKITQRFTWAKGANPDLQQILEAFQDCIATNQKRLQTTQKISENLAQKYEIVLRQETLRSTGSDLSKECDNQFLTAYDRWRHCCQFKVENLLPAEESILNMLSLTLIKNPKWLRQVALDLADIIAIYQKRLQVKKEKLFLETDSLIFLVNNLKSIFNVHTRLIQDVKALIKTMTKIDGGLSTTTRVYALDYGEYVDKFNGLFGTFKEHELDRGMIAEMRDYLEYIRENTDRIYDGLMNLRGTSGHGHVNERRQSGVLTVDTNDSKGNKNDSRVQQRNAYAMNVWRKVKMKLEGRDPDPGRKSTAQEQVDYVIGEATSLENLALLYEGWTPWV